MGWRCCEPGPDVWTLTQNKGEPLRGISRRVGRSGQHLRLDGAGSTRWRTVPAKTCMTFALRQQALRILPHSLLATT